MKKGLSAVLALVLCVLMPLCAMAEELHDLIVSAQVVAQTELAVKAPAGGDLLPFTLREGDTVSAGDVLFAVEPKAVYADVDGTIAAIYANAGGSADGAVARFGSVLAIEYKDRYEIQGNTMRGYNAKENRNLYVGTQVYVRSANEKHFADGIITAVDGRNFTVAVIGGDLVFTENVKVYRTENYAEKALLSRGTLNTIAPYDVSASGTIVEMNVKAGDEVKIGDVLFTYVPDALEPALRGRADATAVKAEGDWIVASVSVTQGSSVQKGQALCTVYPAGQYQLLAKVEEGDIGKLKVGDTMNAAFEELGLAPIPVTVASILALGTEEDTSRYSVYFDFELPQGVALGMHATVQP